MESYASKKDTIDFITQLGFIQVDDTDFFDSPKNDAAFDFPVIQLNIYRCGNGYYCIDADGGFKAPCVWNGPRASWDTSNTGDEFIAWLDKYHPGWR